MHLACQFGYLDIAELLVKKSKELKINLNVKEDLVGWTPFHMACAYGQQNIVSMMTKNVTYFNVNLNLRAKDKEGRTGFQIQPV